MNEPTRTLSCCLRWLFFCWLCILDLPTLTAACGPLGGCGVGNWTMRIQNVGSSPIAKVEIWSKHASTGGFINKAIDASNVSPGQVLTASGFITDMRDEGVSYEARVQDCTANNNTWHTNQLAGIVCGSVLGCGTVEIVGNVSALTNCAGSGCWKACADINNLSAFSKSFAWYRNGVRITSPLAVAGGGSATMDLQVYSPAEKTGVVIAPVSSVGFSESPSLTAFWNDCTNLSPTCVTLNFNGPASEPPNGVDPNGGSLTNLFDGQEGTNAFGVITNYALETTLKPGLDGIYNAITSFAAQDHADMEQVVLAVQLTAGTNVVEVQAAGASVGLAVTNLLNSISNRLGNVTNVIQQLNTNLTFQAGEFKANLTNANSNLVDMKLTLSGRIDAGASNTVAALTNLPAGGFTNNLTISNFLSLTNVLTNSETGLSNLLADIRNNQTNVPSSNDYSGPLADYLSLQYIMEQASNDAAGSIAGMDAAFGGLSVPSQVMPDLTEDDWRLTVNITGEERVVSFNPLDYPKALALAEKCKFLLGWLAFALYAWQVLDSTINWQYSMASANQMQLPKVQLAGNWIGYWFSVVFYFAFVAAWGLLPGVVATYMSVGFTGFTGGISLLSSNPFDPGVGPSGGDAWLLALKFVNYFIPIALIVQLFILLMVFKTSLAKIFLLASAIVRRLPG